MPTPIRIVSRIVGTVKSTLPTRVATMTMNTWEMPSATPMVPRVRKGVSTDLKKRPVATIRRIIVTGRMSVRSDSADCPKS